MALPPERGGRQWGEVGHLARPYGKVTTCDETRLGQSVLYGADQSPKSLSDDRPALLLMRKMLE